MDEDPSNEAFVLSLLEGYGAAKPRPWRQSWPPRGVLRAKYLA
jgi:hypothetical protein